jgi:hypothetical protein
MYASTPWRSPPSRPFLNLLRFLVHLPVRCLMRALLDYPPLLSAHFVSPAANAVNPFPVATFCRTPRPHSHARQPTATTTTSDIRAGRGAARKSEATLTAVITGRMAALPGFRMHNALHPPPLNVAGDPLTSRQGHRQFQDHRPPGGSTASCCCPVIWRRATTSTLWGSNMGLWV